MIMTTRSGFLVAKVTCRHADLSWDCPVQAAQEEIDEETQEQVSMTEAGCFGFFEHEGP